MAHTAACNLPPKLRNPWGHRVWRGAWSDKSTEWTPTLRALADSSGGGHKRGIATGGEFWMSFSDFLTSFDSLTVCRVRSEWAEARCRVTCPSATPGAKFVGSQITPMARCETDIVHPAWEAGGAGGAGDVPGPWLLGG